MSKERWVVFVPIYNLEIADEIGGEIKIEQVYFISHTKISRIRKRFNLPYKVSYYDSLFRTNESSEKLFSRAKVYAVIKTLRSEKEGFSREYAQIREAVYLLASSQFYREKRNRKTLFGGPQFAQNLIDEVLLFATSNGEVKWNRKRLTPVEPYRLNKLWQKFISNHFFRYY